MTAVAERMGGYAQAYTLYSSVRPFGITAIIAGGDSDGPGLYMVEPSGLYWVCFLFLSLSFFLIFPFSTRPKFASALEGKIYNSFIH